MTPPMTPSAEVMPVVREWRIGMTAYTPMQEAIYATGRVSPLSIDKAADEHNALVAYAKALLQRAEKAEARATKLDELISRVKVQLVYGHTNLAIKTIDANDTLSVPHE